MPFAHPRDIPPGTAAAVLGAGHSLGTPNPGAENGPYFLRALSRAHTWSARRPSVLDLRDGAGPALAGAVDLGDLVLGDGSLEEALDAIERTVGALPDSVVPAVIGGDHTVTLPVVGALAARRERPFSVVQFDHHLDLQIWDGAPGDPAAARERIFHTNVMSHVADRIGAGRLVQVGVAPYATVEEAAADAAPGWFRSIGRQLSVLSPELDDPDAFREAVGSGDVYITVDIDVLDRSVMASTGYPAEIGLGVRELLRLIDVVLSQGRLVGFDVAEFAADAEARDARTLADAGRASLVFLHLLSWACRQGATLD
ncbi:MULTISPECIES: arginase family protein [Kitasatospora]|uniref:Arginase family enzyme n=2 Tax=Kitasatospora TaxID=2063 RepID=A0ABT1J8A9_9ACTN|nr:arginase family protein [Kitasatospora paracochleata]MCP2313623.1 arginase family enzyme [Kitasatospora paracochleata]